MRIVNNTPRIIYRGIQDQSILQLVPELEETPQHLPWFHIRGKRQRSGSFIIGGSDMVRLFGQETFSARSPYFTHANLLAQKVAGEGQSVMVTTVGNAKPGDMTLVATTSRTTVPQQYERDANGNVVYGSGGQPTLVDDGSGGTVDTTHTLNLKWEWVATSSITVTTPAGATYPVSDVNGDGSVLMYPILSLQTSFAGDDAKNIGVKLWSSNGKNTTTGGIADLIESQGAMMYALQLIERSDPSRSGNIVTTTEAGEYVEFAFQEGIYNPDTNVDIKLQNIIDEYTDTGETTGNAPTIGHIGGLISHGDNLDDLLTQLYTAETEEATARGFHNLPENDGSGVDNYTIPTAKELLDIFSGVDKDGTEHFGFIIDPTGVLLNENTTTWFVGGEDSTSDFEDDVITALDAFSSQESSIYRDEFRWPMSVIYDSGFKMPGKNAVIRCLRARPDISIALTTRVFGEAPLTISEEISVAEVLRSNYSLYGESEAFGTPVCRCVVYAQSGTLLNDSYRGRVPLLFDRAMARARYMGAGNGRFKTGLRYDELPLNEVTSMTDVDNYHMPFTAKNAVWGAGCNFAMYNSRQTLFFPALQTAYPIKNSVLTSELTMLIAVDVIKMSARVWTRMVGNTSLEPSQFAERSNEIFAEITNGRYDNNVTLSSETTFTPADVARGYSWEFVGIIDANVMRTVGKVSVRTRRQGQTNTQ